jgi:hypothetical protein
MRILKASDIQGPDDPARKLAEQREKAIRDALATMLAGLAALFVGDAVLKMIGRFDTPALGRLLDSNEAGDLFVRGYQPVADTFLAAARQAANDNLKGTIPYDPLAAAATLQALRDQMNGAVIDGAERVIQLLLLDALRTGSDPAIVADRLRQVIGLDVQSAKAVANYRRLLQAGDSTALRRALRDQRYDDLVRQAVRGNVSMHPETDRSDGRRLRRSNDRLSRGPHGGHRGDASQCLWHSRRACPGGQFWPAVQQRGQALLVDCR